MLSNIFARLRTSVRPVYGYQQHLLRLLSTTEPLTEERSAIERETGIVKRFSKEKGYGFISKNSDGTDCFVHFKNISATGFKALEQGQEVEFSTVQGEKGLEAREVKIIGAGTSRASFMKGSSFNNSTSSRFGFGAGARRSTDSAFEFGGTRSSEFHSEDNTSQSPERRFNFRSGVTDSSTDNNLFSSRRAQTDSKRQVGTVKRWQGERGFGFIRPSDGGPDLFCHIRSLKNGLQALEEGQTVQFRIQQTNKGEEAQDVSLFSDETEQEETSSSINPGERQTGIVRRWLPEKNYGFLRIDGTRADVFVHASELGEGVSSLEEGQAVEFDVKNSAKGHTAHNVSVRNKT